MNFDVRRNHSLGHLVRRDCADLLRTIGPAYFGRRSRFVSAAFGDVVLILCHYLLFKASAFGLGPWAFGFN
jgi:hypothetical protein